MPEHELEALKRTARQLGVTPSDLVREAYAKRLAPAPVMGQALDPGRGEAVAQPAAAAPRVTSLPRYHVDMLGPDPLRLDNGATAS